MTRKYGNILDHIGWTPLVPLTKLSPNKNVEILVKLESCNPGGSIKDRAALGMIEDAEERGELNRDKIILEATSGNTGIGLSLVAAVKGYRILLVMAENVSEERKKILRAMGADLKFTPPHLSTDGAIEYVYNLVREDPDKYWLADQYNNDSNWMAHYRHTSMEIWEQTGGRLDAVVSALGTSGTVMGLARRFKELAPDVKVVGIEPYLGHKIQGLKNMKESYRPGIYDKSLADRILNIDDDEAFDTARLLARKEGIFAGMSSGAAVAGALHLAREMENGRIVVILPDGGERYLSTSLFVDVKKSGLFLYNTLTRKKEEFVPLREKQVRMYSCGPTLCQNIHIGQSRRFIFADLIRRYLQFKGFDVTLIMNVTDIDDRTIRGAEEAGMSLQEFTRGYYDAFMQDSDRLRIKRADRYLKASEHVEDMILLTQRLLEKGYAYEKFRSVYFDISRFKEYGNLSRIDLNKIRVGKTVDLEQYEKENPRDFTLLKRSTLNELKRGIFYQTKWGNVRPSWHLECPAMAMQVFGETYDIHTSSVDLVFPHHENDIAISKALTGKIPANYWIHNDLVMIDGKKPSGTLEEPTYTIRNILHKGYTGREIRFCLVSHPYRKPLFFTFDKLQTAKNTLSHLDAFVRKLHLCKNGGAHPDMDQIVYELRHTFTESMDDDLNIARALAALFRFTRNVNLIMDRYGIAEADRVKIEEVLKGIDSVLGVLELNRYEHDPWVEARVRERERARMDREWALADRIRDELKAKGISLTDTRDGTIWRREGE